MTTIQKTHKDAVIPRAAHSTDAGYDVTVISAEKSHIPHVTVYNTHLRLIPPEGHFFELYVRSSLWKKGYMLANSTGGVIDPEYRGELKVALLKFDPCSADLELPSRVGQLILRKLNTTEFNEVEDLDINTQRGEGGFGSTGN